MVAEVLDAYRDPPADRPRELAAFVRTTSAWQKRWSRRPAPRVVRWTPQRTSMGRTPWPIAELPELSALARLLNVDQGELDWFADVRGWERRCPEPLRHYRWRTVPRAGGGSR
jgi:RNA-directed DNA polymerase